MWNCAILQIASRWFTICRGISHEYSQVPPQLRLLVYNPNNYRFNPLINPSEIVLINQLNAFTTWGTTLQHTGAKRREWRPGMILSSCHHPVHQKKHHYFFHQLMNQKNLSHHKYPSWSKSHVSLIRVDSFASYRHSELLKFPFDRNTTNSTSCYKSWDISLKNSAVPIAYYTYRDQLWMRVTIVNTIAEVTPYHNTI